MSVDQERDRAELAALGRALGPDVMAKVQALYRDRQQAFVPAQAAAEMDCAYGPDPRQRLDVYMPEASTGIAPVLIWVHGGGFVRGEKASAEHPYSAHVGRWAAREGMVGLVMNYRLAPDHAWPAGGEDVGGAVDWARAHAARFGGDPTRIVLAGTSAGAVHVATHLRLRPEAPGVAGAVLLSGLYGFTPLDARDTAYYGPEDRYEERWPRDTVTETRLPLLIACAERDPERFQQEMAGLLAARLGRHRTLPPALVVPDHNHFSLACHIGVGSPLLADAIRAFVARCPATSSEAPAP